jgi:uncharacterized membrane protein
VKNGGSILLKYLISTTELLITAAIGIGLILAFMKLSYSARAGRIAAVAGLCAGFLGGGIMSFMKNATKLVDTALCNLYIFSISLGLLVIFFISSALRRKLPKSCGLISLAALTLLLAGMILYALPDWLGYPYTIWLNENSVVSTTMLFKNIGAVLGGVLMLITCLAVRAGASRLSKGVAFAVMTLALSANAARQITVIINVLITKRFIRSNTFLFNIVKFSTNHSDVFIYAAMVIALLIPAGLLIKSLRAKEPYDNPAQKRKIKKKYIVIRRWSATVVCCLVMSVLSMTAVKAYINKPIELSPVEHAPEADGNICVSFDMVDDGHLHRFGYNTESGKEIRFIVIKKPNSSSYGIGLDACDICGETGYYEKDGQVVCKLCDVVMNINTIGFKGGCNPIVIDYRIENGTIYVPIAGLLEHESEFKGRM